MDSVMNIARIYRHNISQKQRLYLLHLRRQWLYLHLSDSTSASSHFQAQSKKNQRPSYFHSIPRLHLLNHAILQGIKVLYKQQ